MIDDTRQYKIFVTSDGQQSLAMVDDFISNVTVQSMDDTEVAEIHDVRLTDDEYKEFNTMAITNSIPSDTIQGKAIADMPQPQNPNESEDK